MPRPTNKLMLLDAASSNFQKLMDFISTLSEEKVQGSFPEIYLNRNIRDVLGHLYHWHLFFFNWYEIGMKGEKPSIPAEGYTFKTTPDLNRMIQKKYSSTPLFEVQKNLEETHNQIIELIESHTDEELFEKKRYKWTGTTSLGAYLISASSSHFVWALKLIKKALK